LSRNRLVSIVTTFFYVGYLPFIPGTFGSLAGIGVYYLINGSIAAYISVVSLLVVLGLASAGQAEKVFNVKDPKYVVIDEVVGMLLSLLFLPLQHDLKVVIMGFFVFRLMDTLKPYPIGLIERLHGGKGIMGDDILAGIYTNIILQAVLRLLSFTAS